MLRWYLGGVSQSLRRRYANQQVLGGLLFGKKKTFWKAHAAVICTEKWQTRGPAKAWIIRVAAVLHLGFTVIRAHGVRIRV